jgi:hypothetical protein
LGGFADSDLAANTQYLLTTVTVSVGDKVAPGHYWIGDTASTVFTDPTFSLTDYANASHFGFTVVAAPEPEAYAFMFLGLIALAGFFMHKRNLNRKFRYLGDSRR